jgi:tetratricopeptide (TPR) repeat protein
LAYFSIGKYNKAIREYEESLKVLKKAVLINPTSGKTHNLLGIAYLSLKRYDDAINEFNEEIEINPQGFRPHKHLVTIYYELGKYNEAISALKKSGFD